MTVSKTNQRVHWTKKARDAREQRITTHQAWRYGLNGWCPDLPCSVTLIRISPRKLDDDNLRGALKSVRDGIADCIGVDDASPKVKWQYGQQTSRKRDKVRHGVRVIIEPLGEIYRCPHCAGVITPNDLKPQV